jgi:hypothetical protein
LPHPEAAQTPAAGVLGGIVGGLISGQ